MLSALFPSRLLIMLVLLAGFLAGPVAASSASAQDAAPDTATYPNAQLLVDVDWLAAHLDDPDIRIIDMRSASAYSAGHIPGAVSVPVDAISSSLNGLPMEFDEAEVQTTLNAIGLTPATTAVIYDDLGMMNSARLFWTLEYVGHRDARVLNGGWNAWVDAELDVTEAVPEVEPSAYPIRIVAERLIDAEELASRLDEPGLVIVDARSPQEYSGGHIPGARLFTWLDALTGGDTVYTVTSGWADELRDEDVEVFKPAVELEALLAALDIPVDAEIVSYCQTLWRGAHVYFLLRLMGYENVRGYDGSWAEWGSRDDLPVVTGDVPGSLADAS